MCKPLSNNGKKSANGGKTPCEIARQGSARQDYQNFNAALGKRGAVTKTLAERIARRGREALFRAFEMVLVEFRGKLELAHQVLVEFRTHIA